MQTSVRVGCFVVLLVVAYGLGAAKKAMYYERMEDSGEYVFTEVDFIDQDKGEAVPEAEDGKYISKKNDKYELVLDPKFRKWVFDLRFSEEYTGVFEIIQLKQICPPAGSPGPRRLIDSV